MSTETTRYRYLDKSWDWDELAAFIDRNYKDPDPARPDRIALALEMVEGREVLDLGCHFGFHAHYLARLGHRVVGAEIDPELVRIGKKKYSHPNLELVQVEGTRLEFADCSFDAVLLLEVLEHTRDPRGLVAEIHRVLRPGGVFILSVPNAASYHTLGRTLLLNLKSYYRKMESWPEFATDQRDHYFYWDPFTLYRLLNYQGFRYVEHKFSDNLRLVNFLARFIPPLGRISTCFIIKVVKER